MPRNLERDAREIEKRKNKLIETGFRLCAEKGIELVKLSDIAKEADVGASTMYNYYQNKVQLVIAISTKIWSELTLKKYTVEELESFNAYDLVRIYIDSIIELYIERPDVLRFSSNFKTYIRKEAATNEQLSTHLEVLSPLKVLFHKKYEQAKTDKSIRMDIPEPTLFVLSAVNILAIAERYATGLVWGDYDTEDHITELKCTKQMILDWIKGDKEQ